MPKNAGKFICECCDFSCSKKSNYDKHLMTRKHLMRINTKNDTNSEKMPDKEEKNIDEDKIHICLCGKEYKHAGSLWNHKKKCTFIEEEVKKDKVTENNKELQEQNNILIKAVLNMEKKMENLESKIENQPPTTTNIVNNFNLNVYLNETCKDALNLTDFVDSIQLQLKNLEDMGKLGYVEGMSNLIITELNNLEKDKRPIHCSDAKRDVLYIKDNDTWEKDNSKVEKVVKDLEKNNANQMSKWLEQNPSAKIPHTEKADEFHKILQSYSSNIDQEKKIKKVLKNIARATPVRETNNID
jgi:hypothetical protein